MHDSIIVPTAYKNGNAGVVIRSCAVFRHKNKFYFTKRLAIYFVKVILRILIAIFHHSNDIQNS